MMGHQSRQMAMLFVDIESLIPETHLLRKIERMVSFDFIYDLLAPYYPATGRPSVDPVSMFKMLLIGYLYGIKSERRLVEEVQLNIAYYSAGTTVGFSSFFAFVNRSHQLCTPTLIISSLRGILPYK